RENTEPDDLDTLGGLFCFPLIRQTYYNVEADVLIGRSNTQLAEEAVRGFSDKNSLDWAFGDEAGSRTNLALARLHAGDLDGSVEAVRPVLDLPSSQRNAGIIISAQRVRSALLQRPIRDSLMARELQEEITAFGMRPTLAPPR